MGLAKASDKSRFPAGGENFAKLALKYIKDELYDQVVTFSNKASGSEDSDMVSLSRSDLSDAIERGVKAGLQNAAVDAFSKFMTTTEIAEHLGVKEQTVRNLEKRGQLLPWGYKKRRQAPVKSKVIPRGATRLYRPVDVIDYIRAYGLSGIDSLNITIQEQIISNIEKL